MKCPKLNMNLTPNTVRVFLGYYGKVHKGYLKRDGDKEEPVAVKTIHGENKLLFMFHCQLQKRVKTPGGEDRNVIHLQWVILYTQ